MYGNSVFLYVPWELEVDRGCLVNVLVSMH